MFALSDDDITLTQSPYVMQLSVTARDTPGIECTTRTPRSGQPLMDLWGYSFKDFPFCALYARVVASWELEYSPERGKAGYAMPKVTQALVEERRPAGDYPPVRPRW